MGLYARLRMSEILVFWTIVREIAFSVRDSAFPVRDFADFLSELAHGTTHVVARGLVNKGSNTRNRENRPTWIYLPPLILP